MQYIAPLLRICLYLREFIVGETIQGRRLGEGDVRLKEHMTVASLKNVSSAYQEFFLMVRGFTKQHVGKKEDLAIKIE